MSTHHLWENLVGAWGTGTGVPYWVLGTPVKIRVGTTVTDIGFYRASSASDSVPTGCALYLSDGTLIEGPSSVNVSGSAGTWVWTALSTPYAPMTETEVVPAFAFPGTGVWGRIAYSSRPAAPLGVLWGTNARAIKSASSITYPDTWNDQSCEAIGVRYDTTYTESGADPLTLGNLRSALTEWESSTENAHTSDGLPWLSHVILEGLRDGTITYFSDLQTRTLAIKAITDALPGGTGEIANRLADWEAGRLGAIIAQLGGTTAPVLTSNPLGGSGTGNALTDTINALRGASAATTTDLLAALEACCDWLTGAVLDEAKLTAPDTATIEGYGYLASGRRIHRLSVGTVPSEVGSLDVGGKLWLPRFGWWAPVTAQGAMLERHYIDWQEQWLWPTPAATAGIAYHLPLGVDATVYAYDALAGW